MSHARLIFHVDLDAFYASAEELDFPELRGQPVIVAGRGGRGVVAAANYPARQFGVHSAMPAARARQLCPQAHFQPPRMDRYRELSRTVFDCFFELTPEVEGLSMDEAFLDLTADPDTRDQPRKAAEALKQTILQRSGLVASVGVAPNKFIAKLASDIGKPNGLVIITEQGAQAFLDPLPVDRLWGVGQQTTQRLRRAGLSTFGSLRRVPEPRLRGLVGRPATRLKALASGEDNRPVKTASASRSISAENTFSQNLRHWEVLAETLSSMADKVATRLRQQSLEAGAVGIKLRTPDFQTYSRQRRLRRPTASTTVLRDQALDLARRWWEEEIARRGHSPGLRLAGLAARELVAETGQMGLFADSKQHRATDTLLDEARSRFGDGVLQRGLRKDKLDRP